MWPVESARMHVARTDESGDALGRRVVTPPFDGLITTLESALGVLHIAKATSWMSTEDLAWSDHRFIFPRISGKGSAPRAALSELRPGVNLKT